VQPDLLGYGSWRSPITSDLIVSETVGLSQLRVRGAETYWVESRPSEGGRNSVVRQRADGTITDVTPAPFNARTRVHEYGGGAYVVGTDCTIASRYEDQMLYRIADSDGNPVQVTTSSGLRFADGTSDTLGRIITVVEDHRDLTKEAVNFIGRVDPKKSGAILNLVSGADFYACPRLSPSGRQLAWLSWNHPNMPWDAAEVWVGNVMEDGRITGSAKVAGGVGESAYQPQWAPDGKLFFVAEPTGWWNIYSWDGSHLESVVEMDAEFGQPLWTLGQSTYDFAAPGIIVCSYTKDGIWHLGSIDFRTKTLNETRIPFPAIFDVRSTETRAVIIGGGPATPTAVVQVELGTGEYKILRTSSTVQPDRKYVSIPDSIVFSTTGGQASHGLYYAPKNDDFSAPTNELPPLIVKIHGGPTAAANLALNWNVQFWTSRGFAVVDVNYGGSTGFGRDYRNRLHEQWGVVDMNDALAAAQFLATSNRVDGFRMAISGGSSGGYTALCTLCFADVFRAGTSLYGISDLEALLRDTHKFESTYPFWLIGPYPETADRYRGRSPVHFADKISAPVIFMQGEDDQVVPPNQTEMMVRALLQRDKVFGFLLFAGEQHGFRKGENIRRALDAELDFFSIVLTKSGLRY
jgi:dipeptidyl aminopeptidase/acylaminoacyl peptidase